MLAAARRTPNRRPQPKVRFETVEELLTALGSVPPHRVRFDPLPGTATERDLLKYHERGRRLYELVDGILVEKPMGAPESYLEAELLRLIGNFVHECDLGFLFAPDVLIRVMPKLVRGPDVSFVPWSKCPEKTIPSGPISELIPELVVEVLSPTNTRGEIDRKLNEYFTAGVRLVWVIDPPRRTAVAYVAPEKKTAYDESGTLDGGDVLPGFRLSLAMLFARLAPIQRKTRKKK